MATKTLGILLALTCAFVANARGKRSMNPRLEVFNSSSLTCSAVMRLISSSTMDTA